jgi:hypothetical protein
MPIPPAPHVPGPRVLAGWLAGFVLALAGVSGAAAQARTPALSDPAAQMASERARLGVGQARTLESFALALGVPLGTADDGPVFAAANKAIVAASHSGGLAVELPMGRVEQTSVGLLLDNNGGYFCPAPGQCTVTPVRAADSSAETWLVTVNDPYATNLVLSGIIFSGGWNYARAPYAAAPETDPWLDRQGGVNLAHAFSGGKDETYVANSHTGAVTPADHIENLVVSNFGGDCIRVSGAGQNNYQNIRGTNCGAYGLHINSYDNKFTDIDFGGVGRACLFDDAMGAVNYIQGKVWYCGFRLKPRDDQGAKITSGANIVSISIQDTYGDGMFLSGTGNVINAIVSWQGGLSKMDPGPIAAITCVGCNYNSIALTTSVLAQSQQYPNVTRLFRDLSNGTTHAANNALSIVEMGWPQDHSANIWQSFWFEGPLDASNTISLNGIERAHAMQPDPSGRLAYVAAMNGSAAGLVVFGPGSVNPGGVAVLCQSAAAGPCALQGFRNTAAFAGAALTSRGNYAKGETIAVGGTVYVFDDALQNIPQHVHIGPDEAATLNNLTHAVNAAGGTPGVDYSAVTIPNAAVTAANDGAHVMTATARTAGVDGNRIAVAATAARAAWGAAALAGGTAGAQSYTSALTWDRDGRPGLPNLPGPYANDAAAAAAGLPLGDLYRDAASVVHVRAS